MQIDTGALADIEIIFQRGWNRYEVPVDRYPSGEPLVRWSDVDAGTTNAPISRLLVRQHNMDAFMTAMFMMDALAERGHAAPELVLPFVPGARQDRKNPEGDYLFTIKSIAGIINDRNFSRVTVVDPHSDVTPALIDRCRVVSAADCVTAGLKPFPSGTELWGAVVSPDAGSEKRSGAVAKALGLPLVYGYKVRDVATGNLTGFGLQEVPNEFKDRPLLVVDDICDGGGTFIGLAAEIAKQDCTADLFVTHGIFAKGTEELLTHYRRIFCTDTVIANRPGVHVLNTCAGLI